MSRAGLIYVCDRQGDRVQVFDKMGTFVRNIWIRTGTATLPDPRGTAWWVAFSRDPGERYMYVMNGRNEQLHILDHASGKILSSFGRPGHLLGNFTHGHAVAVDSSGNLYIAETDTGRRMQKFGAREARN
jgi:DNA-binding beta-propeller fold protein YncE